MKDEMSIAIAVLYCFPCLTPLDLPTSCPGRSPSCQVFSPPTMATPTDGAWMGLPRGRSGLPHTVTPQTERTASGHAPSPLSPPVSPPDHHARPPTSARSRQSAS